MIVKIIAGGFILTAVIAYLVILVASIWDRYVRGNEFWCGECQSYVGRNHRCKWDAVAPKDFDPFDHMA